VSRRFGITFHGGAPAPAALAWPLNSNHSRDEFVSMSNILGYQKEYELALLSLLKKEPDWSSFLSVHAIDRFKEALLESETFLCENEGNICGYLRALVDGFGVYVSELYVAPQYRGNGYGAELLARVRQEHPNQDVYVLSDEDAYYEKLGYRRVGSVFKL
jgi:ribosomal protein S18 acetylase RimI-like enzyme